MAEIISREKWIAVTARLMEEDEPVSEYFRDDTEWFLTRESAEKYARSLLTFPESEIPQEEMGRLVNQLIDSQLLASTPAGLTQERPMTDQKIPEDDAFLTEGFSRAEKIAADIFNRDFKTTEGMGDIENVLEEASEDLEGAVGDPKSFAPTGESDINPFFVPVSKEEEAAIDASAAEGMIALAETELSNMGTVNPPLTEEDAWLANDVADVPLLDVDMELPKHRQGLEALRAALNEVEAHTAVASIRRDVRLLRARIKEALA